MGEKQIPEGMLFSPTLRNRMCMLWSSSKNKGWGSFGKIGRSTKSWDKVPKNNKAIAISEKILPERGYLTLFSATSCARFQDGWWLVEACGSQVSGYRKRDTQT